jgi:hypothetical protein
MKPRRFHKPVVVQPGRIDRDLVVMGPRTAAELLLRRWPKRHCPFRLKAMRACLDVMSGTKPPSTARNAFIRAAKEARIFLSDDLYH